MKRLITIFLIPLLYFSCKKGDNPVVTENQYLGNYKGSITTTSGGILTQILTGHTITIAPTTIAGKVTILNNLIITSSATIEGNKLIINKTTAARTDYGSVVEYGEGIFSGGQLTLELIQESYIGNDKVNTAKWNGSLFKQ